MTRGRRSYAEDVLPVLADIEEADSDEWFRVAVFPTKGAAGRARTVTVKQLGDKAAAWEFQAVSKLSGSALYARRVDS